MPAQDTSWNSKGFRNFSDWLDKSQIFTHLSRRLDDFCYAWWTKFLRDLHPLGSDFSRKQRKGSVFEKDAIMNFMCGLFLKREF